MVPNFFIIGAPKCGTTSLCQDLGRHPEIFMCDPKEPRFFSHDEIYAKGLRWYASLFSDVTAEKAVGEGSTSYATHSRDDISACRIKENIPDAKLIYCVRHPLRRIESIWIEHQFARYYTSGPNFSEGIVSSDFNDDVIKNSGFIDTSCYWSRLKTFLKYFSDEQIRVVFLEERMKSPVEIYSQILSFLDVNPHIVPKGIGLPAHVSSERRRLNRAGALLGKLRGYGRIRRVFPAPVRTMLELLTTRRLESRPSWKRDVYDNVIERIGPDSRFLLEYCGKPANFWSFEWVA